MNRKTILLAFMLICLLLPLAPAPFAGQRARLTTPEITTVSDQTISWTRVPRAST